MCRVACAGRGEVLIPGPCPGTAAGYHGRSAAFRAEVMVKKKDSIRISQENIVHYCNVLLKISQKVRNWVKNCQKFDDSKNPTADSRNPTADSQNQRADSQNPTADTQRSNS